jgi:hypothetical protein
MRDADDRHRRKAKLLGRSIATVRRSRPVPGRSDSHSDGPAGMLAPQGAPVWFDPNTDRPPCLPLDLSAARERFAVRLCLADACDPRRA